MLNKQFLRIDGHTGMRFGLTGVAVALVGAVLAFSIAPDAGYWVACTGVLIGIGGAVLHWAKK